MTIQSVHENAGNDGSDIAGETNLSNLKILYRRTLSSVTVTGSRKGVKLAQKKPSRIL